MFERTAMSVCSLQERENMSIRDWGSIGEMVSATAIIVSLINVGVQRLSTQATRVVTSQVFRSGGA